MITSPIPHEEYYTKFNFSGRPPANQRKFVSPVIDSLIAKIKSQMKDPDLATLFENCYPNTLDTTVNNFTRTADGTPDTFVVTGDIPAMWLRDSTNQVISYLPYASQDPNLQQMLAGVLYRQARSILIDSYANAFNYNNDTASPWMSDIRTPSMTPWLWEGKYELDSLAAFLRYSYYYYINTKDVTPYNTSTWQQAVFKAVATIQAQQKGTAQDQPPLYSFQRMTTAPTDTLMHGTGVPANYTGMSKSPFRPSDDSHTMPFPIAANAMAVMALQQVATIFDGPADNKAFANQMRALASQMQTAINQYGVINHPQYGQIYAYEVDGFGNSYFMDDANVPSLLSLPYLDWRTNKDPLYLNTRKYLLSASNPYWFSGTAASGIGGPHVGFGFIWPLAIIMQAQTSNSDQEIMQCLTWLKISSAGTGFMHESFWKDDPTKFTRAWFAWANAQFGHLILTLAAERPYLIFNNTTD